ncbi:MAG TPA: hypothetical protein DCP14_05130, partial [Rhodobiaceae bacterium]|nr:hypothetical protein [Rhodobiaceae bacterium]
MPAERLDRKVTVILATDVAAYSKHVEQDESLTIKTYSERESVLLKLIEGFRGRVFNTAGDSVLAEFASAVDAVECAAAFQVQMVEINSQPDTECKLEFRIGINMGDVVQRESNLLGDGVNIAARLEALSQPNGVSVSKSIYDLVAPKTILTFNDLGIQKIKENEFHAFDLMMKHSQRRSKSRGHRGKLMLGGGALLVMVIFLAAALSFWSSEKEPENNIFVQNSSEPTVLIYPLENLSDKEDSNSLSAAFTDSMIQNLSQYSGVVVLSGSTSKHAKKNEYSDLEIKENYGASLVVKGSIQSAGSTSRVGIRLIDLERNKVAWSDKYQFEPNEIFEIQDKIGDAILSHLHVNVVSGSIVDEYTKTYGTLENLTIFLNARNEWRKFNPDGHRAFWRYIAQLEDALGKDSPVLYRQKAWGIYQRMGLGISENVGADKTKLFELADADVAHFGSSQSYALRALIEMRFADNGCGESISIIRKALSVGETSDALTISGAIERKCGDIDTSVRDLAKALKITPNDNGFFIRRQLAGSLYIKGDLENLERLVEPNIERSDIYSGMLALLA